MSSSALVVTDDPSKHFEDDDIEICRLLLLSNGAGAGEDNVGVTSNRLQDVSKRFIEDHETTITTKFWTSLIESASGGEGAAESGFHFVESLSSPSSSSTGDASSLPAAFQSDVGKKHLRATASLLNISEKRAAQITLSSLRDVSDVTNLQNLLGTRRLVEQVMEYSYQQRLARIHIITECLRLEQQQDQEDDDGNPSGQNNNNGAIVSILNSIDSTYSCQGNQRGLFRYLLAIACHQNESLSKEHIKPVEELRSDKPMSVQEAFAHSSEDIPWKHFLETCQQSTANSLANERLAAMEALLVLLYHRIQNGITRSDYIILLMAFKSAKEFFTGYVSGNGFGGSGQRLCQLAGLVCAECMALWRVFMDDDESDNNNNNSNWVAGHPLLIGIVGQHNPAEVKQVQNEFEVLIKVLSNCTNDGLERRQNLVSGRQQQFEAPESLALLSFGLLLMLSYSSILESPDGADTNAYWQVRFRISLVLSCLFFCFLGIPAILLLECETNHFVLSPLYCLLPDSADVW